MRIIFLDIDGVLNGHDWDPAAKSNRIRPECVQQLNRIIAATNAKVVLSSAWRYMILKGAMTCTGFEYLLRTHGACGVKILGTTCSDEMLPTRGEQIADYLDRLDPEDRYVILDDDDGLEFGAVAGRLVKTDGQTGLTAEVAHIAIEWLLD